MNWLPKPSLYDEQAAKRAKQKANHQTFLANQSALAEAVGSIQASYLQGTTDNASNAALSRMGYTKSA
jgi:hypothetical protein